MKNILEKLNLVQDGRLTRGATLLFGKNPQPHFLMAQVHMGRFKDAITILDDKLIKGDHFGQLEEVARSAIKKAESGDIDGAEANLVNHAMTIEVTEKGEPRASLNLTILASAKPAARGASRPAYRFEGGAPPEWQPAHSARRKHSERRSGLILAREWQQALADGKYSSRAELARAVGVSRARVTQVLRRLADSGA